MPPRITVGICAYNERKNIGKLLHNILFEQDWTEDYEVLVVCSGCTDNTTEIVQDYAKQSPRVRLYVQPERKGKASAINVIFSEAKGSVILFASADTLPNRECFRKLLIKLKLPKVGIVCGNPVPVNSKKPLIGKLVHLLWNFHDIVFVQLNDAGLARHATEVFCIRRGIVQTIPEETINDDAYIALMTKKQGWLIKYEHASQVSICGPQTFNDYFRQRRRILFGHKQVKKLTGETPQHLLYFLPQEPIEVVKLMLQLLKMNSIVTVVSFISTECVVYSLASIDFLRNKSYTKWSISQSTKTVA